MKHTIHLLTALLLFLHSHADGKAKVFILSGQSNMSGGGHIVEEGLQFDAAVGDKVQIWDACGEWGKPIILNNHRREMRILLKKRPDLTLEEIREQIGLTCNIHSKRSGSDKSLFP